MSNTTAVGFEKFIIKSWDNWDDVDIGKFQFYDCVMDESFCNIIDFPYDRNELFDVYIDLEDCIVQVSKIDSEEFFIVNIIGMNFQK